MMFWLLFLLMGGLMSWGAKHPLPIVLSLALAALVVPGEGSLRSTGAKIANGFLVLLVAFLCVVLLIAIGGGL